MLASQRTKPSNTRRGVTRPLSGPSAVAVSSCSLVSSPGRPKSNWMSSRQRLGSLLPHCPTDRTGAAGTVSRPVRNTGYQTTVPGSWPTDTLSWSKTSSGRRVSAGTTISRPLASTAIPALTVISL